MLEAIHAVLESEADLRLAVRVRHDREAGCVRRLHHRRHLRLRHLVLIDELDDVHPGLGELFDLGPGVVRAIHAPAEAGFVRGIGRVLDEGAGDEEPRPGDLAPRDPPLHGHDVLEPGAQVARRRHAGEKQLLRRRGHDLLLEPAAVRRIPMLVVAVAHDHQVDVHVGEPREHAHSLGRDHPDAGGDGDVGLSTHRDDPLARNEHHAVLDRRSPVAVDHPSSDEGERGLLRLEEGGTAQCQ